MRRIVDVKEEELAGLTEAIQMNESLSKSQKMKDLADLGYTIKEIAELTGVRYNFVYNVVSNYFNLNQDFAVEATAKAGKKESIIELHLAGRSKKEISIELKTNYNYVFNVIKTYIAENPTTETAKETE
jgi:transposase-like protein